MMPSRRRTIIVTAVATATAVALVATSIMLLAKGAHESPVAAHAPVDTPPSGDNPFRTGRTLVIPHGGGDGLFPEDTMLAYESTMAMGADVVDVDVRMSSDGVLVAFHDATVDRVTGTSGEVSAMTYAQLAALDAGWSFHPAGEDDRHPFRGTGVTIPTLEAILDRFPNALLSLDLKDETMAMVDPLCSLLVQHHRSNDVFVGSNSDPLILQFRKTCPTVRTSAVMPDVYAARDARATNDPNFVPAVTVDQPPFRANGRQLVDADSLAWSHQHGMAILTWVVNDSADMQYLVGIGVDGIYTSYPDRLLKLLGRCTAAC